MFLYRIKKGIEQAKCVLVINSEHLEITYGGDLRKNGYTELFKEFSYQYGQLEYAILILQNKELRFNNVFKHWEDPYELFLFKQNIFIDGNPFHINKFDKKLYGQCWSLNKDTDAMWRIYSPKKKGVRIKTTIGKMIKVLNQTRGMIWTAPVFEIEKYYKRAK